MLADFSRLFLEENTRLGKTLWLLRKQRKWTGQDLSRRVGISQSKLSKIENGLLRPSIEDVAALTAAFELPEREAAELINQCKLLYTEFNSWKILHRSGLAAKQQAILELEEQAKHIRVFQISLVPGLLQTPEYAEQVLRLANITGASDIELAVRVRTSRLNALRSKKVQLSFVISECALRLRIANSKSHLGQMRYLCSAIPREDIDLRVLPWETRVPSPLLSSFVIHDRALVSIETQSAEVVIWNKDDVEKYIELFELVQETALTGSAALERVMLISADFEKLIAKEAPIEQETDQYCLGERPA